MTILEKKVDLLVRLSLTADPYEQERFKRQLRDLQDGKDVVGTVREEAESLLTQIGISPRLLGYAYAVEAICIAVEKPELAQHGMVTVLRAKVGKIFDVPERSVERCMRHAVTRCFDNCDPDLITQYFGSTVSPDRGSLSCSEFVAACAQIIRQRTERK